MPTTVSEIKIDHRPRQPYMGIRTQTPFKGMGKVAEKLYKELSAWMKKQGMKRSGAPFLRYHVIDMNGEMDIEVAIQMAD